MSEDKLAAVAPRVHRIDDLLAKTQIKLELEKRKTADRFRQDFQVFARENLSIRPKDLTLGYLPLVLNESQLQIHEMIEEQRARTGKVRTIILKGRQMGASTYVAGRTYWRTVSNPLYQSVIITNRGDTTQLLFDMTRRFYELQPEEYRPKLKSSNRSGMSFEGLDSSYHVYTAGSSSVGRGTTPNIAHASEVAYWNNSDELMSGLFQGISNSVGTEIIIESTANGAGGAFYELWQSAHEKDSEWLPIFIPWYMTSEYRSNVPADFKLSEADETYKQQYGLDDAQMQWRREKCAGNRDELFKQEYPANAQEAFLLSGNAVFDSELISEMLPMTPLVSEQFAGPPRLNFDLKTGGHLDIWEYQHIDSGYVIGADVSNGVGVDYSCAVVMDQDMKVVAMFRDNTMNPGSYGEMLYYLGRRYNNALIVCESNNSGMATLNQLNNMDYSNLYYETKLAQGSKEETLRLGFITSAKSKPMIISGLSHKIKLGQFETPSHIMKDELMKYQVGETGKMSAPRGGHDDTVIASALCIEGLRTHSHRLRQQINWSNYDQYTKNNTTQWF